MARLEVAGLEHHERVARRGRQQRFDRRDHGLRADAHAHDPLAAEQRDGVRLVREPGRVRGDLVAVEAHEGEGIVGAVEVTLRQRRGALGDQARVRAVDEHHGFARIGAREEAVDLVRLQRGHAGWRDVK